MKIIRLSLDESLIFETVKRETYIKGRFDNASQPDGKAAKLAYEEEAGDDEFHERKLERTLYSALAELNGVLSDYLSPVLATTGSNVTITNDSGAITIMLKVSDRFNGAQSDSLAQLCSKYIEDSMLTQWWGAFNQNQAQFYAAQMQLDRNGISLAFNKLAPRVPNVSYTKNLNVDTDDITAEVGDTFTLTYTIDDNVIDDIECFIENPYIARVIHSHNPLSFTITCLHRGVTAVRLFSRHNDRAMAELDLIVTADK